MVGKDLCFWPAPNFGQKIGLTLSVFLWSSSYFGQKIGQILVETIFILISVLLKFSEVPSPLFKILRTLVRRTLQFSNEGDLRHSAIQLSNSNKHRKKIEQSWKERLVLLLAELGYLIIKLQEC